MAKKITNPEKLRAEIQLQQSKLQSLKLLDQELAAKQQRLHAQREGLKQKASKLQHALKQNQDRLSSLR